jgi:hypothetical protein
MSRHTKFLIGVLIFNLIGTIISAIALIRIYYGY